MQQSSSTADGTHRLAVDVRRLPWIRRLAADYAFEHEQVAPFFAGNPRRREAWEAVIDAVRRFDRPRRAVAELVAMQLRERGAPAAAREAAALLADSSSVAIVTGQQAGLFGGPLFTLLKAVTTLRLARRVADEHRVPVVPIFWIDSEDHDWEEVRACGVLDADLNLREIEAPAPDGAGERAVGTLRWSDDIAKAIDQVADALPASEARDRTVALLRRAYTAGRTVSESFAHLLDALLGPEGLVVFDACDRRAKPLYAGILVSELEHPGRTTRAAADAGAELVARGYHMQVSPHEDSAAVFHLPDGRRPIRVQNGTFVLAGGDRIPVRALAERARTQPEGFSPNVLLRPVVQDTLFPTACYVAGPNELGYLAQLRGVYESFGVPRPLVQLRASATLLDAAGVRFLTRYGVPLETLGARDERALNELLIRLLPPDVERSVREARDAITARMEAVIAAVPAIDPTLEGKARSVLGRMEHELSTLQSKILQAAKRRDETLRRQYQHVQAQAFPRGEPQERIVGGVSFLGRCGELLVRRLLEELPLDGGTHWVLTV
ncbi:MAG TPA: bacillithiol biosynthesis cysteine-adding enzyme BshC [Vicinamibacterales bacterium]|nr:bacillithiol biosynthesis cysteine-adding enzyme BshC [Vicinamibacterales bacterium]